MWSSYFSSTLSHEFVSAAVRVKQTEMFNDPSSDCNVMVATDAIGMGLNL